jgi:formylmethanofuran dehydrogenase subunit E
MTKRIITCKSCGERFEHYTRVISTKKLYCEYCEREKDRKQYRKGKKHE